MPRYLLVLLVSAILLTAMFGCDDRGTNIVNVDLGSLQDSAGVDPHRDHVFVPQLSLQIRNPSELLLGSAYLPKEVFPPTRPVPLLILLAPEGGDKFHYFRVGLEQLAKEMTASGEIQPMVIYCMSNDLTFGGYFYASSGPAGDYDSIIGAELVDWLTNFSIPPIIDDPSKRGIGGIGQGAYGAFRAALKHPGVFSSISVADGPLDFDGSDNQSGFKNLFQDALTEQLAAHTRPEDTLPFNLHTDFDSSQTMPTSNMFIGGALAFSPNDTLIEFTRTTGGGVVHVTIDNQYRIADDALPNGGDSTTLVTEVIRNIRPEIDFDFHLPFDSTGEADTSLIWPLWMRNSLDSLHEQAGGRPLDDVNMWIASNPDAKWEYYDMTQGWVDFLIGQGYPVEEYEYSGFSGDEVIQDEYLFDLLREMLIFHSNNFGD